LDGGWSTLTTSHVAECPDVAPECAVLFIPPHEHHARVGLAHYELSAQYGLGENVQLSLRVPYDVKAMQIRYTTLDGAPFTPPYGDIHHRTETLRGAGDPSLAIDVARGSFIFGGGLSFPLGRIEADPIDLGRRGLTHEHMQFGTGTVQPILAAQWRHARWTANGEARLTLYANREGYRSPHTLVWSVGPSFQAGRVTIDPRLTGQYQSLGRWHGEVDENSGFHSGGVRVQTAIPWRGIVVAPAIHRELWSRSLHHDESFRRPWTWSVMLARTF
jgi:hypothetical protein